jgi:hypothetical protein
MGASTRSCVVDFEKGEIRGCLELRKDGALFVTAPVFKYLRFDSDGLAPVLSPNRGWMYVNKKGKVIISGVPSFDNGPDSFHDGVVRIVRSQKYGFADRQGRIVVPVIYDGALNFEKGRAKVCKNCRDKCMDRECEHHFFAGGEWVEIDPRGTIIGRIEPRD